MNLTKEIPIAFSANDYYVPYMSTMIQSIMENSSTDCKYIFYILHTDISKISMNKLQNQISFFSCFSLQFIDMKDFIQNHNFFVSRHITIETYFRLFLPYIFSEYDKILYFDGDMICRIDISELWNIDMENKAIAAVRDISLAAYYSKKWRKNKSTLYSVMKSLVNPNEYFNAGMLIISLDKMRKKITQDKMIQLIESRNWAIHDQDILNYLLHRQVLLLPYKYNYMFNEYVNLPDDLKQQCLEAKNNPYILHYKPYKKWKYELYFEEFWKYATRTPFIDSIIERMCQSKLIDAPAKEYVLSEMGFWGKIILRLLKAKRNILK